MTKNKHHVDFDELPPLGTVLEIRKRRRKLQRVTLVGTHPYTRKSDGQPSRILVWEDGKGRFFTSGLRAGSVTRCKNGQLIPDSILEGL